MVINRVLEVIIFFILFEARFSIQYINLYLYENTP